MGVLPEVDLVERAFAAWNARDIEAVTALCTPDVEVHSAVGRTEGSGIYRGPEGVRAWIEDNVDTLDLILDLGQALVYRDVVLYLLPATARGAGSGVELRHEYGAIYEIADGRIRRILTFADPREAFAAFAQLTSEGSA